MDSFTNKLDAYMYNSYLRYFKDTTSLNNAFLTSPYFYFKNAFLFNNIPNNKISSNDFINIIKNNDDRYLFIVEDNGDIKNPEFLNDDELEKVNSLLNEKPDNFYALNAYITYNYNKWNLDIDDYFERILEVEKNNPYILVKLARYQASALYKKYKDKKYLELWKESILLALRQFNNEREIPTFFYSWLWYIEHELWNYNVAIELYDKVAKLNKNFKIDVPEPYVWKIFSLNKLWKHEGSLDLWLWFWKNEELNKYNDKRDFRFYKVMADNYYQLWYYKEFYNNLALCVKSYLEEFDFHFSFWLTLNQKQNKLELDWVLKNSYNSFLEYNKYYLSTEIDNIIFSISFLKLQNKLWLDIKFKDSRWIEDLCYNYLNCIYEWKIK